MDSFLYNILRLIKDPSEVYTALTQKQIPFPGCIVTTVQLPCPKHFALSFHDFFSLKLQYRICITPLPPIELHQFYRVVPYAPTGNWRRYSKEFAFSQ